MTDKVGQDYTGKAKEYWKREGYNKQTIACIAEFMQKTDHMQSIIDAQAKEIANLNETVEKVYTDIRRMHSDLINTPVDIIRDVDGTYFTQKVIHKEILLGSIIRVVIAD